MLKDDDLENVPTIRMEIEKVDTSRDADFDDSTADDRLLSNHLFSVRPTNMWQSIHGIELS